MSKSMPYELGPSATERQYFEVKYALRKLANLSDRVASLDQFLNDRESVLVLLRIVRDAAVTKDALTVELYRTTCEWLEEVPNDDILKRLRDAKAKEEIPA